ncbi:MAG: putative metalloprotease CJM1_0395 family protein [Candidatus Kapaibacteriota bacterium]
MDVKGIEFGIAKDTSYKNYRNEDIDSKTLVGVVSSISSKTVKFPTQSPKENSTGTSPKFSGKELSPEEQRRLQELKQIDSKVRAHEMAHLAAGGGLVRGGASFKYEIGPDGKQYAVAGEVKIDMSFNPDDPESAIQKMQQVRRAALAPADPSPQDRSVAQQASNIESQMRAKLLEEKSKTMSKFHKAYKNSYTTEPSIINIKEKQSKSASETISASTIQSLKSKIDLVI